MKKLLKFIFRIVFLVLILCIGVAGFFGVKGYLMYRDALEQTSVAELVAEIQQQPNYVEITELPAIYIKAVISTEDHRFYSHKGVDVLAIGRALWRNLQTFSLAEGGSTITQQLAKNEYFYQEKRLERKVADALMALEMERQLDKELILELYINTIYFGEGYYGIYDASMGYFEKHPAALSDYESTLLAGIPNAPSAYSPMENPDLAHQRHDQVLALMVERGFLNESEVERIKNEGRTAWLQYQPAPTLQVVGF